MSKFSTKFVQRLGWGGDIGRLIVVTTGTDTARHHEGERGEESARVSAREKARDLLQPLPRQRPTSSDGGDKGAVAQLPSHGTSRSPRRVRQTVGCVLRQQPTLVCLHARVCVGVRECKMSCVVHSCMYICTCCSFLHACMYVCIVENVCMICVFISRGTR